MPRGGYRPGAGRKPGSTSRPKPAEPAPAEKLARQVDKLRQTILPPMDTPYISPDASPLEFLEGCMRDDRLPMTTRMQAAALALPFRHSKPILGLKEARRLASYDDDGDDPMALAMSGN